LAYLDEFLLEGMAIVTVLVVENNESCVWVTPYPQFSAETLYQMALMLRQTRPSTANRGEFVGELNGFERRRGLAC